MRPVQLFLGALVGFVAADVSISKPNPSQTYTVDGDSVTVNITWIESNAIPLLSKITSYSFLTCTGPNTGIDGIEDTLIKVSASDISDYTYSYAIPASAGADGPYYVQIYAATADGYTIHYSNRFTLEGMTGSLKPNGTDSSPPDAQTKISTGSGTTLAASALSASFKLAYSQQTGLTRYAPMQTQPGSTVTATTWTRKFPTSAVTYYSTALLSLAQVSTVTQGWDYTMSSAVNWASTAPAPSDNGGWYNPSSRLKSATITGLTSSA